MCDYRNISPQDMAQYVDEASGLQAVLMKLMRNRIKARENNVSVDSS